MSISVDEKSSRQERQYEFPYHYLPYIDQRGVPRRSRSLVWGFEYLCYQRHIIDLISSEKWESLLDVGCGDGRLLADLAGVDNSCLGIDLSEVAIGFGKAFAKHAEFAVCAIQEIKAKYDVVLAVEVLEHIPDDAVPEFTQSLLEAVRPGGRCIISVPSAREPVHPKHFRHYTERSLLNSVNARTDEFCVESVDHVYKVSRLFELVLKLLCNRWLTLEVSVLNRALWAFAWKHLRISRPGNGRHIVLCLRRKPGQKK